MQGLRCCTFVCLESRMIVCTHAFGDFAVVRVDKMASYQCSTAHSDLTALNIFVLCNMFSKVCRKVE